MRQGRQHGFSLIELLVVIVILGLGLATIACLFTGAIVTNTKARRINTATERAQQEVEKLRSGGFASAVVDSEIFPTAKGYTIITQNANRTGRIGFAVTGLPGAQGTIDIDYYSNVSGVFPNLKVVTVGVTWQGGSTTPGQVSLQSMLANHP